MRVTTPQDCKREWNQAGWCVYEGLIPPALVAGAQAALPDIFPTADQFADNVDPERNRPFLTEAGSPRPPFPFERNSLNRVALHDNVIDLAELLLESDDVRCYQCSLAAKYSDAAPDYEQLLHVDYANHTLVVPRTDAGYQHVLLFIYLSDVTPGLAATRIVSRQHTGGIPVERTYLHMGDYRDAYAHEEPASGPAGSVLVYRPDVYHRGVPMTVGRAPAS